MVEITEKHLEDFKYIIQAIERGEALRNAVKGLMAKSTFYQIVDSDEALKLQYEKAKINSIYKESIKCKSNPKGSVSNSVDDYRCKNARLVNSRKFPNSDFYILFIKETNYYKLGVSQNLQRRFRDIKSSMPFDLEIVFTKNIKNAYSFEEKIHKMYSDKYIKNEWFSLSEKEIENIKMEVELWLDL